MKRTITMAALAMAMAMLGSAHAQKAYSDVETIRACTETRSGEHCYSLAADLTHWRDDGGREIAVSVERIHFDTGRWLDFNHVPLPGSGVNLPSDADDREREWSFSR